MRRDILLPGLAVAGGALGFGLRRWQVSAAYDPETQLFRPGAPATWALLALLLLLALAFFVLSRGMAERDDFLPAFRCPATPFLTVMTAAAFLFLGTGPLGLLEGMEALAEWRQQSAALSAMGAAAPPPTYPAAILLRALLCLPAGVAVLLLGRAAFRGELTPACSLLASFPPFAGMVWVFAAHLEHGSDPQLLRYGFPLLAAGLLTLAHYGAAGFLFGQRHPGRTVFCALMGSAVGLLALADRPGRTGALLTLAFTLSSLGYSYAALRNGFGPPWPEGQPQEVREEDPPRNDNEQE